MAALFARPELVAHRPDPAPDPPAASLARLERERAHWAQHGFGRWTLVHEGRPVGFGGLTLKAGFEGLNLSYHLHPDAWGRGFAREFALEAVVAAWQLGARRVIGLVRPVNLASRAVLEHAGFALEREVMLQGAPSLLFARLGEPSP